ncbi:AGC family protein kinase [Tritrichomonas foetus]|uniref:AGC family protein kinase n=1 Tax=Tritrichomonas foetus TaxID=1144522 RepID=A0A1J4JCJ4_9EUKA|nr:AGC family protein kinase [Tritrichomonas foetus]|eukprot:OHS94996.1 AGC family protein kinase [Tritrichomonas foetus]
MSSNENTIFPQLPAVVGPYLFQCKIGAGGFGSVYKTLNQRYNVEFAAKVLPKKANVSSQAEIETLLQLVHPNILRLYDVFEYLDYYILILELCNGGSINDPIALGVPLSVDKFCTLSCQIIDALEYMHNRHIAHCDIKPNNLLINNGRVKIADFGLSTFTDVKGKMSKPKGVSFHYAPPEVLSGQSYNPLPADVWSLGITLYKMATGSLPWKGKEKGEIKKEIINGFIDFEKIKDINLRKILYKMLTPYPTMRATMKEVQEMFGQYAHRKLASLPDTQMQQQQKLKQLMHFNSAQPRKCPLTPKVKRPNCPLTFSSMLVGRTCISMKKPSVLIKTAIVNS